MNARNARVNMVTRGERSRRVTVRTVAPIVTPAAATMATVGVLSPEYRRRFLADRDRLTPAAAPEHPDTRADRPRRKGCDRHGPECSGAVRVHTAAGIGPMSLCLAHADAIALDARPISAAARQTTMPRVSSTKPMRPTTVPVAAAVTQMHLPPALPRPVRAAVPMPLATVPDDPSRWRHDDVQAVLADDAAAVKAAADDARKAADRADALRERRNRARRNAYAAARAV